MYDKTDYNFALTIIYTALLTYPLHSVDIFSHKTHFHTIRQVYEHKLWADKPWQTQRCELSSVDILA